MVAKDFIELFSKFSYSNRVAVEDFSERLSLFTVVLFLLSCVIVSAKQYFLNSISCYIPVKPSGDNYNNYLADYCWVHGTIPLGTMERMPSTPEEWDDYDEHRRINYYQWVPFVLGLQCMFFYFPHIIWSIICSCRSGGDLFSLIKVAADGATLDRKARVGVAKRVAEFVEDMILCHQDIRKGRRARMSRKVYSKLGLCMPGKRIGTCLVFSYLLVKLFTIVNAVVQLCLIQRFLGFNSDGTAGWKSGQLALTNQKYPGSTSVTATDNSGMGFGLTILNHIVNGRDWPQTLLFPRVAYCRVPGIRLVGVENAYTAQCTLAINMLNEKIYIFLWFWIVLMAIVSSMSLVFWLFRLVIAPQRTDFIKRYLRLRGQLGDPREDLTTNDRLRLTEFSDDYLRRDGVFILRMLSINAGDVMTSEIVTALYQSYKEKFLLPNSETNSMDKEPLSDMEKSKPPQYV